MAVEKSLEYERRVRSLKKRLTLDFQPLRDTLSRGLDVLIDPEAAVLCTATVEAMCDALFNVVIKSLHDDAASSLAPLDTKVTIYHLQVALRSHPDFALLLQGVESAAAVLEYFLDDTASKSLYERQLIATREAKHLRSSTSLSINDHPSDDELIALHERTRCEWQKREDDPFTDVDFARVLKCVHPAFTLAYSATLLLSALVRELLNEVCDRANVESVQRRVPPELYVEDLAAPLARVFHVGGGELGRQIDRTASECLERFRLRSRQGATLTLRFRVYNSGANAAQSSKAASANNALANVSRDAKFAQLLVQMCRKSHLEPASMVGIYRGHQLEASASPALLSMPTCAVVYLVSKKWWDHTRRNEARRGLLSSLRPQDAQLKSLVEGTESKVKREFQGGSGSPTDTHGSSPFGFLPPAASPAKVLSVESSKRLRTNAKSVHAVSASRLLGSTSSSSVPTVKRSLSRRYSSDEADEEDDGGEDEEEEEGSYYQIHDEDSLSTLLKQRQQAPLRRSSENNSKKSPVASSQRTAVSKETRRSIVMTMATQSTQLMDTLDKAWLGFAGISAGVRSMKEKIQSHVEDPPRGAEEVVLEEELVARLEKTRELVRQAAAAHELVAQLLEGTRRLRGGPKAVAARRGGGARR